jgi:exosortase F-associated protein
MQKNKQIDTMQLGVLLLLVLALVSIRIFENSLFYDPLIAYYKGNFNAMPLPKMHQIKLFTSLGFRIRIIALSCFGFGLIDFFCLYVRVFW